MRTLKTFLMLAATALLLAGPAYAQPEQAQTEPPPLSAQQISRLDSLRMSHLREILPLQTELRIKELELESLWLAEELAANRILAKVKEMNELHNRMQLARVNHRLAIYRLLTREQRRFGPFYLEMDQRRGARVHERVRDMKEGGCSGRCHETGGPGGGCHGRPPE